jgi:putative transposase
MARPLRIQYEGALYHITSRGNAGAKIFQTDSDRRQFLDVLSRVVSRFGWICHAYCLMSNHYHLLIETPSANLSQGMQLLNGVYTQRFNRASKRSGHVFQGRFKAILVEKESHLLELARYIVLNPVRARAAQSARAWSWSSYRATAGLVDVPEFLTVDWVLSQFGAKRASATRAYRQGCKYDVWEDLRAGSLLGSDEFAERMKPLLADAPLDPNILRRERDAARPSLKMLFTDVTDRTTRNQRIHDAVREHHYTLQEVGQYVGLHFSTISVIAKQVAAEQQVQE